MEQGFEELVVDEDGDWYVEELATQPTKIAYQIMKTKIPNKLHGFAEDVSS